MQNLQAEVSWFKLTSAEPIVSICVSLVFVFVSVCEGQHFIQPVFVEVRCIIVYLGEYDTVCVRGGGWSSGSVDDVSYTFCAHKP